jgi:hypothetical protein
MADSFSSGLSSGMNSMTRLESEKMRNEVSQERADTSNMRAQAYSQGLQSRLPMIQARANLINAQIKQMPEMLKIREQQLAMQGQGQALQLQNMQLQQEKLQQLISNQGQNQVNKGRNYQVQLDDGSVGNFQKPSQSNIAANQKVIAAWPQFVQSLGAIQKGAASYQTAHGKATKYLDSMSSYMTGTATPDQMKILSDAGITQNELTNISEISARLMQIAKTDGGFEHIMNMFQPVKGDTAESYANKLQQASDDMQTRVAEAQYENSDSRGVPLNDAGNADQDAFIQKVMTNHRNVIPMAGGTDSGKPSLGGVQDGALPAVVQFAKKHGISYSDAEKIMGLSQ